MKNKLCLIEAGGNQEIIVLGQSISKYHYQSEVIRKLCITIGIKGFKNMFCGSCNVLTIQVVMFLYGIRSP